MAKKTFAFSIFLFAGVFTFAAQEKTVMVYSKSMDKNIETVIISPDDSNVRCSTIYMLHGFNGNARSWINIEPRLKEWSDKYYIVFVFPDGKRFWWVDSPVQNSIRYETFVSSELVNYIDTTYNTLAYPQQRAITGYSTGGSGAVRIAVKHPNVFSSAGSSSGIFDLLHINWVPVDISPRNDLNISSVLGARSRNYKKWRDYSVLYNIKDFKQAKLNLIFDCGFNDITAYKMNDGFHKNLLKENIPHIYISQDGVHSENYWRKAINFQILFFVRCFESSLE